MLREKGGRGGGQGGSRGASVIYARGSGSAEAHSSHE